MALAEVCTLSSAFKIEFKGDILMIIHSKFNKNQFITFSVILITPVGTEGRKHQLHWQRYMECEKKELGKQKISILC